MLSQPEVVAAPDQPVLVLEAVNRRIQVFGRSGHPVKAFDGTKDKYAAWGGARCPTAAR